MRTRLFWLALVSVSGVFSLALGCASEIPGTRPGYASTPIPRSHELERLLTGKKTDRMGVSYDLAIKYLEQAQRERRRGW